MQHIEQNTNDNFDSSILKDLSFILKHKRYPFKRMTLMPLLSTGASTIILLRFFLVIHSGFKLSNPNIALFILIFIPLVIIPLITLLFRYKAIISFTEIKTNQQRQQNIALILKFLQHQKIRIFQHPEAQEVIQILGAPIQKNTSQREVLIFIADDNRILINSHFTAEKSNFSFMIPPVHTNEMKKLFHNWFNEYNSSNITAVKSA